MEAGTPLSAAADQSFPQRLSQAVRVLQLERRLDLGVGDQVLRHSVSARRLGVPEVDVQSLDLLDQQEDRSPRGPDIGTVVGTQTVAPRAQLVELRFIQPFVDDGQSTTGTQIVNAASSPDADSVLW